MMLDCNTGYYSTASSGSFIIGGLRNTNRQTPDRCLAVSKEENCQNITNSRSRVECAGKSGADNFSGRDTRIPIIRKASIFIICYLYNKYINNN
jgi:hypothetical protein